MSIIYTKYVFFHNISAREAWAMQKKEKKHNHEKREKKEETKKYNHALKIKDGEIIYVKE